MRGEREPWTAPLHVVARAIRRPQEALVRQLRGDFERAPHWVLLTTRGRKTGLPREVLLPCGRKGEMLIAISTYGYRSAWVRNIEACGEVRFTARGKVVEGTAEIIDDLARKREWVEAIPFVPLLPLHFAQTLARTAFRPLVVPWLRGWVATRPVVVIRPLDRA